MPGNRRPSPLAAALPASTTLGLAVAILAAGCSDSSETPGTVVPPISDQVFELVSVTNGFGQQLPHIGLVDDGSGGQSEVELRTHTDFEVLIEAGNTVKPTVGFPNLAVLPDGRDGNQFFLAQFTDAVDAEAECFSACTGQGTCYHDLFELITFDPVTQEEVVVPARVFIGGFTRNAAGDLEQWATMDPNTGELQITRDEAIGFPGFEAPQLPGAGTFAAPSSIMVVMDADDDLSTFESFPTAAPLQLRIPSSLCSTSQVRLLIPAVASAIVGSNTSGPEVVHFNGIPKTNPRNEEQAVDPLARPEIRFTEAIQPESVGALAGPANLGAIDLIQAPDVAPSQRAYNALPRSPYDLTTWRLVPSRPFDGLDPGGMFKNLEFARVEVVVHEDRLVDLIGMTGQNEVGFRFLVNRGASTTNAPVVPESLLLSRGGSRPGLSVIDLNGFGQSTGNPVSSQPFPLKGESRFPYNPNVTQNPTARPLLNPGMSTVDGGSAGVFTLTLDINRDNVLAGWPTLADASDAHYGSSLDTVFRNAPPPFGCQVGGGNVCALDGIKSLSPNPDITLPPGAPNLVSFPMHPNPPRLMFPGRCVFPAIDGDEPTSVDSGMLATNLLVPGNPFPDPSLGAPPTGLLRGRIGPDQFYGPSFGQTTVQLCNPYGVRQQIGQFLYIVDSEREEIAVLNSNRMFPLERIHVPGVTSMGMSPNLDILAVTSGSTGKVSIIDINPGSATFHRVLAEITVGHGPRGIAFDPLDEDILVCNELDNTISIIDPLTLTVRKTVPSLVDLPFELAVTQRMTGFAFQRGVYFAYVLGRNGEVAVFESGPDGANGIGYDSTIGVLPFIFQAPKAIALDPTNLDASVYIAYEGPLDPQTGASGSLGVGAVSRLRIESALFGEVPLQPATTPNFRDLAFSVPLTLSQATGDISGIPSSIAFDELVNYTEYPSPSSPYTSGEPAVVNGKAPIRQRSSSTFEATNDARLMFVAIPDAEVVDVAQLGLAGTPLLDTCVYDTGVQSIPVPDVRFIAGYFSQ